MTSDRLLWTVEEAAELLDPPATPEQVLALLSLAWLRPAEDEHGRPRRRRTGRPGRPPLLYDASELQRAHAYVAPLLARTQ